MECIRFTAEALTPLVIAGAGGDGASPVKEGLRAPSLRGLMRFWFRAMMGGVVNTSGGYDKLRNLESRVFGSTKAGSAARIRSVARSIAPDPYEAHLCMNDQRRRNERGADKNYIAIKKEALPPGSQFDVELGASTQPPLELAAQALWLAAMLGGVGNRSRRGFGSLSLEWADPDAPGALCEVLPGLAYPDGDIEHIATWLEKALAEVRSSYARLAGTSGGGAASGFSALSGGTARLWLVTPSNGFWSDWSEAMGALREDPYRAYKANQDLTSIGNARPREASPLIIQIKRTSGGEYFGVLLAFENAKYLGAKSCHLDSFLKGTSILTSLEVKLP